MAFNWKQFKNLMVAHKEGLIIGAVTGFIAANYTISQGYDLNTIVEAGKGLIDNVLGRSAPVEIARYKLYGTFMSVFAAAGFGVDVLIHRLGLYKRKRKR